MMKLGMRFRRALRALGGEAIITMACRLLRKMLTVRVQAVPKFVVRDHFRAHSFTERFRGVEVNINSLDEHFKAHFLDVVEEDVPAAELMGVTLTDRHSVTEFFQRCGDRAETALAHIWELLAKQGQCQKGDLVVGQNTKNSFLVSDGDGTPWEIRIWSAIDSWNIEACWPGYPRGISDVYRVFSR